MVDVDSLELKFYPEPVLKRRADPVAAVTDEVRAAIDRMFEIMYEAGGIGIAAPQVGWSERVFVVNLTADPEEPDDEMVFINPVTTPSGEPESEEEGCLSFPDLRVAVRRPEFVRISAIDEAGEPFELEADGLLGRCLQHELDHLDGILFVDRAGFAAKLAANKILKTLEREYKARRK